MKETKKILLDMRKQILNDIEEIRQREHAEHDEIGDDYDKAAQERERELGIILTAQEKNKLIAVDDALKRIDEGTYGICDECGEKISKQRLNAVPFAAMCVACKSKKEVHEGFFTPFEEEEEETFQEEPDESVAEEEEE